MKKILLSLILILLIFGGVKVILSEPQIEISKYSTNPKDIYPGGEFTLTINVVNNSSKDKAKNIVIEIKKVEGKNDLSFFYPKNKTTTRRIDELDTGKDKSIDFTFQVDKGAPTGIYRLIVNLSWQDEGYRNYSSEELISLTISPPSIDNRPLLTIGSFKTIPSEVSGGDIFDSKLYIKNIGGKLAKNIKFEINKIEGQNTLYYFSPNKSGNVVYVDRIDKQETKEITMSFLVNENILKGNYNFIVNFTYEDENRLSYDGSEIVGLYVEERKDKADVSIVSYRINNEKIIPGSDFTLNIKIENSGVLDAKNIRIYPSNIEGENSLKYFSLKKEGGLVLNSLKSKENFSYDFYFYVDKDAPNKLYQIVFKIEYEDIKNRSYSLTKNIGVLISVDKPDLIISNYSLDKENVIPGDSFNLKLNIKNIGEFDANDIKVTLKNVENTNSLSPFSIISKGNTIYIKEIKANEESSVDFGLKLSDDAQDNKVYNLVVSVSCKDVTSKDYSKDETLSIYVSKKEKSDEPNLILKSISFEPKILNPGTSFRLNIKILNNGGTTAKNSKLEFTGVGASTDLSPFSFVDSGSLIYLGDIKSAEEKNAQVNLNISKDAKDGVYNISIKLTYENSEKYSETQKIGVVIQKSEPQRNVNVVLSSYLVTPEISTPGGTVEIDYVISNISKESAYNVTHKIEKVENSNSLYPFSPISTSNINTTRLIQGYSSVSSKFKFIISGETESGNYNLVFTITYEDSSGNTYSNTSTIGVVVLRKPIISIFNLIYPDKVKTNEKFTLSCEIANLGKFSINGVLITLEGSPIKGVDKFIGTLDPGISDTYEAELFFDKVNVYNMALKVQYVDDSNNLHYEKRDIKIEVIEESKEPTNTTNTQKLSFWQRLLRFILSLFGLGK